MNKICSLWRNNVQNQAHTITKFNMVVSYLKDSHFHNMGLGLRQSSLHLSVPEGEPNKFLSQYVISKYVTICIHWQSQFQDFLFTLNFNFEDIPGWFIHIPILLILICQWKNFLSFSFWGKYLAAWLKILFNIVILPTLR